MYLGHLWSLQKKNRRAASCTDHLLQMPIHSMHMPLSVMCRFIHFTDRTGNGIWSAAHGVSIDFTNSSYRHSRATDLVSLHGIYLNIHIHKYEQLILYFWNSLLIAKWGRINLSKENFRSEVHKNANEYRNEQIGLIVTNLYLYSKGVRFNRRTGRRLSR
jgi:hypothetical protein